jgi:stage V sporulation protein B
MVIQVVFARELGAEGFGLFNAVSPIVYTVMTLATMALPTALAKVIAEAVAVGDTGKVRFSMSFSKNTVVVLSVLFSLITLMLAPTITSKWLDPRTYALLVAAIFRVPIVCLSSVIYGYYMGIQNQTPPAVAWIIETLTRTVITIPLIYWANQFDLVYGAVAVMVGHGIGELAGFLYMYRLYKVRDSKLDDVPALTGRPATRRQTIQALAEVAVPTTFRNILGLIAYAAEPMIVYLAFADIGVDKAQATILYGSISMALQLLLLPTVLSGSLSTILVPAVSEAVATQNASVIRRRLNQIMRVTLMIGFPSTAFFLIIGKPIATALYGDSLAGALLAYLAPVCVFAYIQEPLFGILQGMNKATLATFISLGTSIIRMYGIYYFVRKPGLGIYGVANAAAISAIITTLVTFYFVKKYVKVSLYWRDIAKMLVATAVFTLVIHFFSVSVHLESKTFTIAVSFFLGSIVYVLALFMLRVVRPATVERIPGVGRILARYLRLIPYVG